MTEQLPCGFAKLRVYDLDGVTLRDEIDARGISCTWPKGEEGGATYSVKLLQQAFARNPNLLQQAVVHFATPLAAGEAPTEIFGWISAPGAATLIGPGEGGAKEESRTNRGLLAALDRWLVFHDPGDLKAAGGDERYVGYMSTYFDSSGFAAAKGVPWSSDPTWRGTAPGGPYPTIFGTLDQSAQWIAAVDPTVTQPAGTKNVLWGKFTTGEPLPIQLIAAADNILTLYLDAELIYSPDGSTEGWRDVREPYKTVLPAGNHVVVALIENGSSVRPDNPIGFICHVDKLDAAGNPTQTLLRSDTSWKAADASAVPAQSAAQILLRFISEASTRGIPAATRIQPSFTATTSSAPESAAWPGLADKMFTVLTKGGQVARDLSALAFDLVMRPGWHLDAFKAQGTDKSATVVIDAAHLVSYACDGLELLGTRMAVKHDAGYLQLVDTTAESAGTEPCEVALESGLSLSSDAGGAVAEANLGATARETHTYVATFTARPGVVPFRDFSNGDRIGAMDRQLARTTLEVVRIDWSVPDDGGPVTWVVELKEPL